MERENVFPAIVKTEDPSTKTGKLTLWNNKNNKSNHWLMNAAGPYEMAHREWAWSMLSNQPSSNAPTKKEKKKKKKTSTEKSINSLKNLKFAGDPAT